MADDVLGPFGDTRPIRTASRLRSVVLPAKSTAIYKLPWGCAKSLWVNDAKGGTVGIIAGDHDSVSVPITLSEPGLIPIRVSKIDPTITTANNIVALYD